MDTLMLARMHKTKTNDDLYESARRPLRYCVNKSGTVNNCTWQFIGHCLGGCLPFKHVSSIYTGTDNNVEQAGEGADDKHGVEGEWGTTCCNCRRGHRRLDSSVTSHQQRGDKRDIIGSTRAAGRTDSHCEVWWDIANYKFHRHMFPISNYYLKYEDTTP